MTSQERAYWLSDALGLVYSAPLALLGVGWLAARTRLEPVSKHPLIFLLVVALVILF